MTQWGQNQWGQTQWGQSGAGMSPPAPTPGAQTRVEIGGFYVDSVELSSLAATPFLCCQVPAPNQVAVPVDSTIRFKLFDLGATGLNTVTQVWVTESSVETLVWDEAVGPSPGWSAVVNNSLSPGAAVTDIKEIILSHTADFTSEDTITVRIHAETNNPDLLDTSYQFVVEDTVQPALAAVQVRSSRVLRVEFSEDVVQSSTTPGSALCVQDISGRVQFIAPNIIEAPNADFVTAEALDLFIGVAGAQNALNNGAKQVAQVLSKIRVVVDEQVVDEGPADLRIERAPLVTLTCYRVLHIPPATGIEPAFQPIAIKAEAVDPLSVAPGTVLEKYVDITFHDALTPLVNYNLEAKNITDPSGNEIGSLIPFSSWSPFQVPGRQFDLWANFTPQINKREDSTGDLERFIKCLNEVTMVMLNDLDEFGRLLEPASTRDQVIDVLLAHLGNPFSFTQSLSLQKKRDLVPLLVDLYKMKGTEEGIEDAVLFFLGIAVDVVPFFNPSDSWILGVSELGVDTILAPGSGFLRYAFEVISPVDLTADQVAIINEIVEFMRPAHTHYVRLQTPSTIITPPSPGSDEWLLGISELGESSILGL